MPFHNIKTRMQSTGGGYTGVFDYPAKTLKNDGIGAFWRGTSPRLVRLTVRYFTPETSSPLLLIFHNQLSSGIAFTAYDQIIQAAKLFQNQPMKELQML